MIYGEGCVVLLYHMDSLTTKFYYTQFNVERILKYVLCSTAVDCRRTLVSMVIPQNVYLSGFTIVLGMFALFIDR